MTTTIEERTGIGIAAGKDPPGGTTIPQNPPEGETEIETTTDGIGIRIAAVEATPEVGVGAETGITIEGMLTTEGIETGTGMTIAGPGGETTIGIDGTEIGTGIGTGIDIEDKHLIHIFVSLSNLCIIFNLC